MTPAETPTTDPLLIRVTGPRDLVDLVPYLVGFRPSESLVLVSMSGRRRRVGLTLRVDLDGLRAGPEVLDTCVSHLIRAGAAGVMLLVYRDPTGPEDSEVPRAAAAGSSLPEGDLVDRAVQAIHARGVHVDEALLVTGDRWWSYLCHDPACCPPEGSRITRSDQPSAVVAAATVAGLVAAPDRRSLEHSLDPAPTARRAAVARLVADAQARADRSAADGPSESSRARVVAEVATAVAGQRRGRRPPDDMVVAGLLVALRDIAIRDHCCQHAARPDSAAMQSLSGHLARLATAPYDVAPYTVLAFCAWRDGNGALSRIAVERALRSDKSYSMAVLLQQALDHGIDPSTWRDPR